MDLIQIVLLSVALSIDSLVIALTCGAILANNSVVNVCKIAGMLGIMQFSLTVFGWLLGSTFASYIEPYDHWIAFAILLLLGLRVIYETIQEQEQKYVDPLNIRIMFGLAVATSIDAMAVGLSFSLLNSPIVQPAFVIGVVTFIISSLGVIFGCRLRQYSNVWVNILGGIILIGIGGSILFQHTIG